MMKALPKNPTHRHKLTGALVFPAGYRRNAIEPLPDGYWDQHERTTRVAAIKAEAARKIEDVAPLWRQINDLTNPNASGAAERRQQIEAIRAWSNAEEEKLFADAASTRKSETKGV